MWSSNQCGTVLNSHSQKSIGLHLCRTNHYFQLGKTVKIVYFNINILPLPMMHGYVESVAVGTPVEGLARPCKTWAPASTINCRTSFTCPPYWGWHGLTQSRYCMNTSTLDYRKRNRLFCPSLCGLCMSGHMLCVGTPVKTCKLMQLGLSIPCDTATPTVSLLAVSQAYRALLALLRTVLKVINLPLYPPWKLPL